MAQFLLVLGLEFVNSVLVVMRSKVRVVIREVRYGVSNSVLKLVTIQL